MYYPLVKSIQHRSGKFSIIIFKYDILMFVLVSFKQYLFMFSFPQIQPKQFQKYNYAIREQARSLGQRNITKDYKAVFTNEYTTIEFTSCWKSCIIDESYKLFGFLCTDRCLEQLFGNMSSHEPYIMRMRLFVRIHVVLPRWEKNKRFQN